MCAYRENLAKILYSYQRCWLIWSSSSLLRTFVLDSITPTDCPRLMYKSRLTSPRPRIEISDSLLRNLTPNSQRPSFFLPVSQFQGQLSVWSSRQDRQTKEISHTFWCWSKILKIRPFNWSPIHEHSQKPTYTHTYIYIHTHTHEYPLLCHRPLMDLRQKEFVTFLWSLPPPPNTLLQQPTPLSGPNQRSPMWPYPLGPPNTSTSLNHFNLGRRIITKNKRTIWFGSAPSARRGVM